MCFQIERDLDQSSGRYLSSAQERAQITVEKIVSYGIIIAILFGVLQFFADTPEPLKLIADEDLHQ